MLLGNSPGEIIRRPDQADVQYMIENIRQEDIVEMEALDGTDVQQALSETPDLDQNAYVWEKDGKVMCMFGVNPLKEHDGVGVIWMLATEFFDEHFMIFAHGCKDVVKDMIDKYEYVFNYVYCENKKSIRWLKWLGFDIKDPEPIGHKGANFHRFEMINV